MPDAGIAKVETVEVLEQSSDSSVSELSSGRKVRVRHKTRKCRTCQVTVKSDEIHCPACGANLKQKSHSFLRKKLREIFKHFDRMLDKNIGEKKDKDQEKEKKKIKYRW